MPIYQTAQYKVKAEAIDKVKQAIQDFVVYIKANEPGTKLYFAWQQQDNLSQFMHFFIFENEVAQKTHSESVAVKKFESIYSPELVGGNVKFTNFQLVASL